MHVLITITIHKLVFFNVGMLKHSSREDKKSILALELSLMKYYVCKALPVSGRSKGRRVPKKKSDTGVGG